MEIKNKLTVTRGDGGGDNGKRRQGDQGTCVKDSWTKPKGGRVGLEWEVVMVGAEGMVGENGDNCT